MTGSLADLARQQHGAFTLDQALDHGRTLRTIRRKLATGEWVSIHPGVLAAATTPRTFAFASTAALLAVPGTAALCGRSGAYALDVPGFDAPDRPEVVSEQGRHRPPLAGVDVRQRSGFGPHEVRRTPSGLLVLERHLLLADLGRLLSTSHLLTVVQEEAYQRRIDLHRLAGARRRGRAGSTRLGEVLAVLALHHATLSEVEGTRLLRGVSITDVEPNTAPYDGMWPPDLLIRAARLAIDFQGAIHRLSLRKQQADSDKVTQYALRDHLLLTPTNETIWLNGEAWARSVKVIADERRARYAA